MKEVIREEGPDIVIKAEQAELDKMCSYVENMHRSSGLYEQVLASPTTLEDATRAVLEFLTAHNVVRGVLAGNSIHTDRSFLHRYMPELFEQHLDPVSILDVSSFKELSLAWYGIEAPKRTLDHRSLSDIRQSIEELRFYRENVFKNPG